MLALALRIAPYLLALAVGAWGAHQYDGTRYSALQGEFSKYQSQVAQAELASQTAARKALQGEIDDRTAAEARNAEIEAKLESANHDKVTLAASNQFANRLLAAASKAVSPACGNQASTATDNPPPAESTATPGGRRLAADLGLAAAECSDAIERLAALQAELIPQLKGQ